MSVVASCVLLKQSRFSSQEGPEIFLFSKACRPALGPAQPPTVWVLGFFSQEESVNFDCTPPSSAEVKIE